jgi:hypothetical protein
VVAARPAGAAKDQGAAAWRSSDRRLETARVDGAGRWPGALGDGKLGGERRRAAAWSWWLPAGSQRRPCEQDDGGVETGDNSSRSGLVRG